MIDYCIDLDTPEAIEIGFTSDKFDGYLWRKENCISISFIISRYPGQGNLSKLFDAITAKGIDIKVPNPFPRMESICKKKGFIKIQEPFAPEHGINDLIEAWVHKYGGTKE